MPERWALPKLQIPERYQVGLSRLRDLGEHEIAEIRGILDQAPHTLSPATIADWNLPALAASSIENAREIVTATAALYVLKSGAESVSNEKFADDICDAMQSIKPELKLTAAQRPVFRAKLLTLLSVERFGTISKAFDLQTDDERVFCDVRVLTDLRPVFGAQIKDGSRGVVIVHYLKLGYHEGSKTHQKFYVALDSDDLKELKKTIERAEEKAAVLKSQFKDVRFLGVS